MAQETIQILNLFWHKTCNYVYKFDTIQIFNFISIWLKTLFTAFPNSFYKPLNFLLYFFFFTCLRFFSHFKFILKVETKVFSVKTLGVANLRFLPKKKSLRPIINLGQQPSQSLKQVKSIWHCVYHHLLVFILVFSYLFLVCF